MSLGLAVHKVVEALASLPVNQRFKQPLLEKFDKAWQKVSGQKGGFFDPQTEKKYKDRGIAMIQRVVDNPGPLKRLAVKIKEDLPYYWLSEKDNIILCGKIDWLEYLPDTDSVHLIDFKTGKQTENEDSLQLPIYTLLLHNCQQRQVTKASYWYLESQNKPVEQQLPDLQESEAKVLKIAKKIKLARQLNNFKCHQKGGCYACKQYEAILRGEAKLVGQDDYRSDVYAIPPSDMPSKQSQIL